MAEIIPITINGTKIIELESKQDWINQIPRKLPLKKSEDEFLFVDKNNNLLTIGRDFQAAEEQGAYLVTVYLAQRTSDVQVKENPEPKYLMWTGNYVGNSLLFWRKEHAGYTTDIAKSHHFSLEEAQKIIRQAKTQSMISLDYLKSIATMQVHADHLDRDMVGKEVSNG